MGGSSNFEEEYARGGEDPIQIRREHRFSIRGENVKEIVESDEVEPEPDSLGTSKRSTADSLDNHMVDTSGLTECQCDEGDADPSGVKTPGTDVSSVSRNEKVNRSASRMRSANITEFRQNQKRCMEALRKGQRMAAVSAAFRQTSEPVGMSMLSRIGKQVSEDQESIASDKFERYSDFTPVAAVSEDAELVADPLVTVVRGLTMRQQQAYEQLLDKLSDVRQEASVQRQEMKDLLRRHAHEIGELKHGRSKNKHMPVLTTFAAAFGAALGLSNIFSAIRGDRVGRRAVDNSHHNAAARKKAEAANFVLPQKVRVVGKLAMGSTRRPRASLWQ